LIKYYEGLLDEWEIILLKYLKHGNLYSVGINLDIILSRVLIGVSSFMVLSNVIDCSIILGDIWDPFRSICINLTFNYDVFGSAIKWIRSHSYLILYLSINPHRHNNLFNAILSAH
jgi:hypothetical protein